MPPRGQLLLDTVHLWVAWNRYRWKKGTGDYKGEVVTIIVQYQNRRVRRSRTGEKGAFGHLPSRIDLCIQA